MTTMVEFNRGIAAAEASSKPKSYGPRLEFFNLKDGESMGLRFLTDGHDFITVDMHQSVPTQNPPANYTGSWPQSMPAVCRNDSAFTRAGMHGDCYICANADNLKDAWGNTPKPKSRIWALAVVRDKVIGDGSEDLGGPSMVGKPIGFTDSLREVEVYGPDNKPTGEIRLEPRIVIINQALRTFFQNLNAMYQEVGTVLDRDYIVRRNGAGTDTSYTFIPQTESKLKPGSEGWARYENALRDQNLDLEVIVASRANDEYYGRFFDPTLNTEIVTVASPAAQPQAVSNNDVDPDKLASIRDRMKGYRPEVD